MIYRNPRSHGARWRWRRRWLDLLAVVHQAGKASPTMSCNFVQWSRGGEALECKDFKDIFRSAHAGTRPQSGQGAQSHGGRACWLFGLHCRPQQSPVPLLCAPGPLLAPTTTLLPVCRWLSSSAGEALRLDEHFLMAAARTTSPRPPAAFEQQHSVSASPPLLRAASSSAFPSASAYVVQDAWRARGEIPGTAAYLLALSHLSTYQRRGTVFPKRSAGVLVQRLHDNVRLPMPRPSTMLPRRCCTV